MITQIATVDLFLAVGAFLVAAGIVRLLLVEDRHLQLVALNVAAGGSLVLLTALAARLAPGDPVPHALALTGIVITVCFTGVGLVLAGRIARAEGEAADADDEAEDPSSAGGTS